MSQMSFGQTYAIINDRDGYANLRDDASDKAKIVTKVTNGEFVSVDVEESKPNWIKVSLKNYSSGYINKSRLLLISNLPALNKKHVFKNGCTVYDDKISVTVKSSAFKRDLHKFSYHKDNKTVVDKIDGHAVWGEDGDIPKRQITSINIVVGDIKLSIPKNAFKDLYEPNYSTLHVYMGKNDIIYIKMDNSDGAGGYTVIWTIKNGIYVKRYVDNSFA